MHSLAQLTVILKAIFMPMGILGQAVESLLFKTSLIE
jgi:hypothetical protein